MPRQTAFHWLDPRAAHQRLVLAVLLGVVAWFGSPASWSAVTRGLLAGNVAGLGLLAIAGWIVVTATSDETRRRSAAHDPGRTLVWVIVLAVSSVSLFAATFVLRHARSLPHDEGTLLSVLAISTAALSWLLTHAGFTLRYAHLYYRDNDAATARIGFAGEAAPDDLDFAYFAFTLGMCFQVSDATINDRLIRRTALLHAMVSFVYNTAILALVLNIVMSQLS